MNGNANLANAYEQPKLSAQSNAATDDQDLQQLLPRAGRLGIGEIPFRGYEPTPDRVVPPPKENDWGIQVSEEDALRRFVNRSTQGLDGGGRSTDITRFTPQLINFQQDDDLSRHRMFERNSPAVVRKNVAPFV